MKTRAPAAAGLAALAALLAVPAAATNSPIELKTALARLMASLPGEYDSEPQRFFEAEYKTPPEQQHARVYRRFTRIEAPDVGANVLVATVHGGDKYAPFDLAEFQVWTLTVDETRRAVRMSPRRFRDPAKYQAIATDAARLRGLAASELVPATGAAGCDLYWRLIGSQLRARNDPGTCQMTLRRQDVEATFDWEWLLNDEELWITFAGRDANGRLVMGRADQTHWRLMKARTFECFVAYRPEAGPEQVLNGLSMHDRGDVLRLELKDGAVSRPAFLELIRGVWPSNSGRNYLDLLRFSLYEGRPEDPPEARKLLGNSTGSAATDRAGFTIGNLSSRCKLPKTAGG
jgi:hypothetical protein